MVNFVQKAWRGPCTGWQYWHSSQVCLAQQSPGVGNLSGFNQASFDRWKLDDPSLCLSYNQHRQLSRQDQLWLYTPGSRGDQDYKTNFTRKWKLRLQLRHAPAQCVRRSASLRNYLRGHGTYGFLPTHRVHYFQCKYADNVFYIRPKNTKGTLFYNYYQSNNLVQNKRQLLARPTDIEKEERIRTET